MKLGMEAGLGPGHSVLDGDPATPPKKGLHSPQFLAHVFCGQTARWIKMPRIKEVGLGSGHIVLDRDPASQPPPISAHVCCGQTGGWMKMPFGTEVGH